MPTTEDLIYEIEREGVILDNRNKIHTSIANALCENRFSYLYNASGNKIGFYTWCDNQGKILINNLLIYRQYRNRINLLQMRNYFRNKYPNAEIFYWKNRKTGEIICHH
jgi:hypothetical protein